MKNSKENDNDASSNVREPSSTAAKQHGTPQLLTALIVKAQLEGHTMQYLARVLGVFGYSLAERFFSTQGFYTKLVFEKFKLLILNRNLISLRNPSVSASCV